MGNDTEFLLEVLVDFIDDALFADHSWSEHDIDNVMRLLAGAGVRRVSWAYYGDGHGGLLMPENLRDGAANYGQCQASYQALGNPLRVAVAAGHRYGMEVYAYFKPYESGVSMVIPEGANEARESALLPHIGGYIGVLDPFVRENPQLRIQRKSDDLASLAQNAPSICALCLTKRDATPTRVSADHLQIWVSHHNYQYTRAQVPFTCAESVTPAPQNVYDHTGTLVTAQGTPVRMLTLSGLHLDEPYILVTTDFTDNIADFSHSGTTLLTALDAENREIPGVIATGAGCWLAGKVDFRQWGLIFDYGWGKAVTTLDMPNTNGRDGIIAFARGKNATLPAALCETEPAVQAFWLRCLREMVDAGVDGVDFREENHCTHTDEPLAYGFNPVVLARCRPGKNLNEEVARVRGEAYTDFLRQAKSLLDAHGVRLRYHLNMDHFRLDPPACRTLAFPANLHFDWRRWLAEGLLDEAVLRSYHHRASMLTDQVGAAMVAACREHHLPISFNHHIFDNDPWYAEEASRVATDGRFAGLILYETNSFLRTSADGACHFTLPVAEEICHAHGRFVG